MYSSYPANHQHESQGAETLHGKQSVSVLQGDLSEDDMSDDSSSQQYNMQSSHSGTDSHHHNDERGEMQHDMPHLGHGHSRDISQHGPHGGHSYGIHPGKEGQHGMLSRLAKRHGGHGFLGGAKGKKRSPKEFAHASEHRRVI